MIKIYTKNNGPRLSEDIAVMAAWGDQNGIYGELHMGSADETGGLVESIRIIITPKTDKDRIFFDDCKISQETIIRNLIVLRDNYFNDNYQSVPRPGLDHGEGITNDTIDHVMDEVIGYFSPWIEHDAGDMHIALSKFYYAYKFIRQHTRCDMLRDQIDKGEMIESMIKFESVKGNSAEM